MKKVIKKIKFFFDTVVKSLTKFSYYNEIKKAKFKFSLKYLFFLFYTISIIGSLAFAISIGVLILPRVPGFISTFRQKASSLYPAGLVITVKDGMLSTNVKEPFYIDTPKEFGINTGETHFITIDESADPSQIRNKNTFILVNKDSVVTLDKNNSYQVYPIDKGTSAVITQNDFNKTIDSITPYLKYIEPGIITILVVSVVVWPFIAAAFSTLGELIYLLIFTAIFSLVVRLMKKDIEFKKLYQLSMHGATLPILLGIVVGVLGIQMPFLLGSAILLVFMILVINEM